MPFAPGRASVVLRDRSRRRAPRDWTQAASVNVSYDAEVRRAFAASNEALAVEARPRWPTVPVTKCGCPSSTRGGSSFARPCGPQIAVSV